MIDTTTRAVLSFWPTSRAASSVYAVRIYVLIDDGGVLIGDEPLERRAIDGMIGDATWTG